MGLSDAVDYGLDVPLVNDRGRHLSSSCTHSACLHSKAGALALELEPTDSSKVLRGAL